MKKYDVERPCPKCGNSDTKDKWDFYPTKREYDKDGVLTKYETTKLIERICRDKECGHKWFEIPNE